MAGRWLDGLIVKWLGYSIFRLFEKYILLEIQNP